MVVELDGAELPLTADRVADLEVDLRPVEGPGALVDAPRDFELVERRGQRRLRLAPGRLRAERLLGPRRELDVDLLETERAVDLEDHVHHHVHLGLDVLLGAEYVGVVLRERPHPGEAGGLAGALVAMQPPEVGVADR